MSKFNPGEIKIEGTKEFPIYESDVEAELTTIPGNPVGRLLLELIDADPSFIKIVPYAGGGCHGAHAQADKPRDASPKNVKPYAGYADGEYSRYDHAFVRIPFEC